MWHILSVHVSLNFHHRNEDNKDFTIGYMTFFPNVEEMKSELDKCDLLCANCHQMEHENNFLTIQACYR